MVADAVLEKEYVMSTYPIPSFPANSEQESQTITSQ